MNVFIICICLVVLLYFCKLYKFKVIVVLIFFCRFWSVLIDKRNYSMLTCMIRNSNLGNSKIRIYQIIILSFSKDAGKKLFSKLYWNYFDVMDLIWNLQINFIIAS